MADVGNRSVDFDVYYASGRFKILSGNYDATLFCFGK